MGELRSLAMEEGRKEVMEMLEMLGNGDRHAATPARPNAAAKGRDAAREGRQPPAAQPNEAAEAREHPAERGRQGPQGTEPPHADG
eukprot:gene5432-5565_t